MMTRTAYLKIDRGNEFSFNPADLANTLEIDPRSLSIEAYNTSNGIDINCKEKYQGRFERVLFELRSEDGIITVRYSDRKVLEAFGLMGYIFSDQDNQDFGTCYDSAHADIDKLMGSIKAFASADSVESYYCGECNSLHYAAVRISPALGYHFQKSERHIKPMFMVKGVPESLTVNVSIVNGNEGFEKLLEEAGFKKIS